MNDLTQQIREDFKAFVADESRYLDFVRNCNTTKGRLLFWQEKLWSEFLIAHSAYPSEFEDVAQHFRFCIVHGDELIAKKVKGFKGHITYDRDYAMECSVKFPYALRMETFVTPDACKNITRYLCKTCRTLHDKKWR